MLTFGPIETFSAYPFENYNRVIKKLAKRGNKPLEQSVKRISEIENQLESIVNRTNGTQREICFQRTIVMVH